MRLTYNTPLIFQSQEDSKKILQMLGEERLAFNFASKLHYGDGGKRKNSIVDLHAKFYYAFRKENPEIRFHREPLLPISLTPHFVLTKQLSYFHF